jgi:hypothetical protein
MTGRVPPKKSRNSSSGAVVAMTAAGPTTNAGGGEEATAIRVCDVLGTCDCNGLKGELANGEGTPAEDRLRVWVK